MRRNATAYGHLSVVRSLVLGESLAQLITKMVRGNPMATGGATVGGQLRAATASVWRPSRSTAWKRSLTPHVRLARPRSLPLVANIGWEPSRGSDSPIRD